MISIPTDSLNKFLAIGSIISMVLLIDICLKNYEKAELAYIAAYVKGEDFREKYNKYAAHVNSGIALHNEATKKHGHVTKDELNKVMDEMEKASLMNPEMDKLSLLVLELGHKAALYERIKWIWIILTLAVSIICSITAFIGFKGWYLNEKKDTII